MIESIQKAVEFLEGVSAYLRRSVTSRRLGYCSKHRAEHTGKICYLSVIDLTLFRLTGREEFREEAIRIALRVADRLGEDPRSGASVFLPGALDHRNAANHAIDSGAAVDCLATVLLEAGGEYGKEDRARCEEAVKACADSYLMQAVRTKGIPAQRLWAGTGLASAFRLLKDESHKEAALDSLDLLLRDSYGDGAVPYLPDPASVGEHMGQSDVTSYYHSRCIGFALFILEQLEEEPSKKMASFLERSLEFLLALYGGDGLKVGQNEAKQWYWESPYEVASHSFDVHALIMGWRRFNRDEFRAAAARSFEQLDRHRLKDGGIHSHRGRELNFQCRLFWNSHAAWVARVVDDVPMEDRAEPYGGIRDVRIDAFPGAGLVKAEGKDYYALFRGAKQPMNISFGSPAGGGNLIYFGKRKEDFRSCIETGKWSSLLPGSFVVRPAKAPSLGKRVRDFWVANKRDVRFRFYIAFMELTGGHPLFAALYPIRHVLWKFFSELPWQYASHWDCEAEFDLKGNRLLFHGALARRSGRRFIDSLTERCYDIHNDRVLVKDSLVLSKKVKKVFYGLSPIFQDLHVSVDGSHTLCRDRVLIYPATIPGRIEVEYSIPG